MFRDIDGANFLILFQQRVKALIKHKLSLGYHSTMADPEWRDPGSRMGNES
jgi:hypothetical protein